MVGTHTLQKGKGGKAPFKKPSNSAAGSVPRGWSRRAVANMADLFTYLRPTCDNFFIQMVIWKDKKVLSYLSTWLIEPAAATTTRWCKAVRTR